MNCNKTIDMKRDITIDFRIEWPRARGLRFLAAKALIKLAASVMPVGCRVVVASD